VREEERTKQRYWKARDNKKVKFCERKRSESEGD